MRIGIAGITGRMGRLLIEESRAAGHEVVGGTARSTPAPDGIPTFSLPDLAASADVVIDFTHAAAAAIHAEAMARSGTPWVLGTSGLSAADESAVDQAAQTIPVVYAANFGPGVNVLLALARQLGAALPAEQYDAEIVEMHHRQKVDAPSGTAIALGRAVAKGRGVRLESVMQSGRHGHTGPRPTGAIGFAALRGGQVVGEHTLLFAAAGEQIALSHRALDRRAFAAGAVRAAVWVADRPPGRYGMADVLGLPA
ncbi:MAG: 4-hydroxy-tetrahydrodipicolinate reductase [Acetobacteraceae bacterium]|nr:4-hydroxy-tetrahydrodipicolinate reductase [Acetobacteraceae bacterium]